MAGEETIVIVGGSGVFGSRLAAGLAQDGFSDLVIAGRDLKRAESVARQIGARAVTLDLSSADLTDRLKVLKPWLVIDAAGPFQGYGAYTLAEAAIAVGAHYFDLSDDGSFTAGIKAELDEKAKAANVVVRSGVSSVPALSAAAVRSLAEGLTDIELIETVILPGNRAPRGLSVMKAILAQAGKPLKGGDIGWVAVRTAHVAGLARLASPIGAPDLHLMPQAFNARQVRFFAGLELSVMHRALEAIARIVKAGLMHDATWLARPLRWAAGPLYYFGSDKGAMRVRVVGRRADGHLRDRHWSLLAIGGDGPHVPALPGRVMANLLRYKHLKAGACAELHDIDLRDAEQQAPPLQLTFERGDDLFVSHFQKCLGADFDRLPEPLKSLHLTIGRKTWHGKATVSRGGSLAARFVAWAFQFPAATDDIPVSVTMDSTDTSEVWTRSFGSQVFKSELTPDPHKRALMWERFGLFTFAIDLEADETGLTFPLVKGRLLGLPIPRALLPKSDTKEEIDPTGRATFSVRLSMPLVGPVVHYQGWLEPADP